MTTKNETLKPDAAMPYDSMLGVVLTMHQVDVMCILSEGGKIFSFDDGTVGLDDWEGNSLHFRKDTFEKLLKHNLIYHTETPALGCEIYEISERGHLFLITD